MMKSRHVHASRKTCTKIVTQHSAASNMAERYTEDAGRIAHDGKAVNNRVYRNL